jgi:hypothetical protein
MGTTLDWNPGQHATTHDVYFGSASILDSGDFRGNQPGTSFDPGSLQYDTLYYWRIDEVNESGTTQGVTWSFRTEADPLAIPPGPASSPGPAHLGTDVSIDAILSWTGDPLATSHDVYFDTDTSFGSPTNQVGTSFDPGTLLHDTTYYWRVDEVNVYGTATGALWSFSTESAPVPLTMAISDLDGVREDQPRNRWQARITAEVRDGEGRVLENATVYGTWSSGTSGSGECSTGGNGRCDITKDRLKAGVTSVGFTVTSVTHAGAYNYEPSSNADPDGETNGTSITIPTGNGGGSANAAPSVSITNPTGSSFASGTSIEFSGNASDDEDGDLTTGLQWTSSLDSLIGNGGNFSTSNLSAGDHVITASISDSGGENGSDTVSITVTSGPPTTVNAHVFSLNESSSSAPKSRWSASVHVKIHNADHDPLPNVEVTGSWSNGTNGSGSCPTDGGGECTITKNSLKGNVGSVTFTITGIAGTGVTYQSGENEASATSTTVLRP